MAKQLVYIILIFLRYNLFSRKERSKRKFKPSNLYPSVNVPRRGEKERKKLKEEKNKHKDESLITGNGKSASVDLSKRKIRKDKIPGPPYVCQGCHATYSQRKTLRIHVKSGKCQGVPKTERPKHKVIKGRYFCLHPVCVPPDGELDDQVRNQMHSNSVVREHFLVTNTDVYFIGFFSNIVLLLNAFDSFLVVFVSKFDSIMEHRIILKPFFAKKLASIVWDLLGAHLG